MIPQQRIRLLVMTCCLLLPGLLRAEDGVSTGEVRVGMVNALSGPAAGLGSGMRAGVEAYFAEVNAAGGINGRRISLLSKDDGYEPARTVANTQALIESGTAFALMGYVGTPTSRAVMPIVQRAQVPYLFPFSGAQALRTPVHKWVFNIRASYFDETEEMVARMTEDLAIRWVAVLMQDDSFGETVKSGLVGALHKRYLKIHAEARFKRNSMDLAASVAALKASEPQAIFFVGTYKQLAEAIRQARASGVEARFFTVSFIGTNHFIAEAGANGDGVHITQVVPSPDDLSFPLVRNFRAASKPGDMGYAALEGYIGAAVFVEALRNAGAEPTRERLVKALEALDMDLGGFKVSFSPTRHQGSDAVYLTRIQGGKAVPVEKMY